MLLASIPNLRAQSGIWTNNVGGDASGTWSAAANWNNGVIADGQDNTADFGTLDIATNSVVTLDAPRTIGHLLLADAVPNAAQRTNWVLTGSALTLQTSAGTPTITTGGSSNVISAVLAGTNGFTKAGAGTLKLGAANNTTLSGFINLNAGVLQAANNNALGVTTPNNSTSLTNAVIIASGATLEVAPAIAPTLKPVYAIGTGVGGALGAIHADLSSLGNNNNATRLSIGLLNSASPAVTVLGDTTIRIDGTNSTTLGSVVLIGHITTSNALTGIPANHTNFTLTKTGNGRLSIDPATGYSGGNLRVAEGAVRFGNNSDLLASQTVTVDAGAGLHMGNITSMNSINSTIALNGLLDLNGRGNGNPGSDTTIAVQTIGYLSGSGVVTNGGSGNNQTATLVIGGTNGSTTTFSGTIARTTNGAVALRIQNTNSALRLTGANPYVGQTVINAGTLIVNGSHTGGGAYTVASGATLAGSGTISSAVSNAGGTIMAGDPATPNGTLTISNAILAASSGAVIISNATLAVSGNIGASGQTISTFYMNNGTLRIPLPTLGASVFVSTLTIDASSTIQYSMETPLLGQFPIIAYGSLDGAAGFAGLSLVSPAGVTAHLSNNVANSTIDVVITAIPALTWSGLPNGNWDIGTTTNWQGGLTWTEPGGTGLFAVFNDTAPGTTSVNLTTTLTPQGVIVKNTTLNYTFSGSGQIAGAGGILKQGSGSLTVANSGNTFAGGVSIEQGTVQVGNGGATGDLGSGGIANLGTLALNRSDSFALANTVSGNGAITKSGADIATVPVSGDSTGSITVNAGTLLLAPSGSSAFSGDVTGGGTFGMNGAGTLILSGLGNSYSGGTVISNGTLQFGDAAGNGTLPPAGNITVNGTLATTLSGTLANNVSGIGGVTILSNATLTFSGTKSYTGPTVVRGNIASSLSTTAAAYPSGSRLVLGNQAGAAERGTVDFTAGDPVLGGLNAGDNSVAGNFVNLSAGNQVLSINGNVSIGSSAPAGASTLFQVIGAAATVVVNTNGGNIQIGLGATGSGVNPDNLFVDFSAIDNFIANLGATGVVNLGTLDGNPGPAAGATVVNQLLLASVSNSITANAINIGAGGRQLIPELRLGAGVNHLNVNSLNLGAGGRDGGALLFNSGSGSVRVRGADGVSRANMNVGVHPTTGTGAGVLTTVDLTGHDADLLLNALVIGNYPVRAGGWTNTFSFNQGVLDAFSTSISAGKLNNANLAASVVNIGGGTASLGPVILSASPADAALNINNATVSANSISDTGAGLGSLDINNSTLNVNIQGFGNPATPPVSVDVFNAAGTVNLGVNGTGFAVGQFALIKYTGLIGGSGFSSLNLASLPAGVSGFLSNHVANLSVDLVITAAPPAINPNPTNITITASSGQVTVAWPESHRGWLLQSNGVSLLSTGAWVTVIGSGSTNVVTYPVDNTRTNVYFRMLKP